MYRPKNFLTVWSLAFLCCALTSATVLGQDDGGNGDTGDNTNTIIATSLPAGVEVDANGVLRTRIFRDPTGQLMRARIAQMRANLDPDIARPSNLRKVSLTRLEAEIGKRLERQAGLTDDMRYLAGLTELQYVFFYPDTQDVVIAGPAEGYIQDLSGRVIGIHTGRSVLELQDLVVALRAFAPTSQGTQLIGCSIDPTTEGLQRMQQFLASVVGRIQPGDAERVAMGLRESLGQQDVTIKGVSSRTHFAQILVEADYRMKLIGIGLERPPVKIPSYVSKANPAAVARNALQRWYFVPNYESVRVSEDGLAMELVGEGVKLISEDEMVRADGTRQGATRRGDRASQAFVNAFTKKYPELARRSPVFAQLRNLIDMAIAAAFMHQEDYFGRAEWSMALLGDERLVPVEQYTAPSKVESAVNVVWKGRTLMTPIGGGVHIQPAHALNQDNLLADENGELAEQHAQADLDQLPDGQWWWD